MGQQSFDEKLTSIYTKKGSVTQHSDVWEEGLEACRETIQQENPLIRKITKFSQRRPRMKSAPLSVSKFYEKDILYIRSKTNCVTYVTLTKYRPELSTPNDKEIFEGTIGSLHVYVTITFDSLQTIRPLHQNIFLPIDFYYHKSTRCKEQLEISVKGAELFCSAKRSTVEKLQIITQLLLEMDRIHNQKYIHNDIKPSNIITLRTPQIANDESVSAQTEPTFLCKFIDFELGMQFDTEDGDCCMVANITLSSTSGTSNYNAPEKNQQNENYIHPKTDIFSLGLVFVELILEQTTDPNVWNNEKTTQALW